MKRLALSFLSQLTICIAILASNSVTTVTNVSNSITLSDEVDYTITSTTPFTSSGSINITNTEHAVVIIKNIKPSLVVANWLQFIFINGETAVDGGNCQVKMYAQGSIIMPYSSDIKPLTCYTEPDFGGESYNAYSMGHSGGYMNTLSVRMLNNQIRSFKLKRGYMVTFSVGTGGWGYSRCFIADKEDLEFASLPNVLDGKISSYRIFKWYDAQKKGLASNANRAANYALNTSWAYDWAQGNSSLLPDTEWVPNHIYEDYPSSATCGSVTGSCHMKNNNEPRNESDDRPQELSTILNNWQNLMRTGMRLCSPSSWDGSDYWNGTGFIKTFLDSIDARGWRCDIVDAHCYWNSGNFANLQNYWWPSMKRPIWISEWIWGSSWGNNGCWGNGVTDTQILNTTKDILSTLNAAGAVERYAYWNSESKGHIYENGSLTELGKYYASMETGIGYNKSYEFIPKVVYKSPSKLTGTYSKNKNIYTLSWSDPNGDMLDSIVVECKLPGQTSFIKRNKVTPEDKSSNSDISYTYNDTITEIGIYNYRIVEYYDGKRFTTNETSVTIAAAQSVGSIFYGQLSIGSSDAVTTDIETQDKAPYVIMGMVSNKNASNGITNQVQSMGKSSFKFRFYPWTLNTPITFNYAETVDYLLLPPDTVYHLGDDMMLVSQKAGNIKGDEVQITFPEAFPDGIVPVVLAQQNTAIASYAPVTIKIYDVTNTGFKARLVRQEGVTTAFNAQNVNYFAATPGQISIGEGKMLTVGRDSETPCGGSARQTIVFRNTNNDTLYFKNPYIIAAPQTNNYEKASVFRIHNTTSGEDGVYKASIRRQVDETSTVTTSNSARLNGDYVGWFIISDDPNGTGEEKPIIVPTGIEMVGNYKGFNISVNNGIIYAEGHNLKAYSSTGMQVKLGEHLPAGVYIVTNGKENIKVRVH